MHESQVKESETAATPAPQKKRTRELRYFVLGTVGAGKSTSGQSYRITCADKPALTAVLNDQNLHGDDISVIRGYQLSLKFKGYSVN